ncbi:MAG: undecaprenyl-diphosphatase [Phycisphaerales bacterium]|jgi:membrane-associated phospholipid phosphatase|nr:undecaprenyl-diphosphatase [Phycisphaerales bacterium]
MSLTLVAIFLAATVTLLLVEHWRGHTALNLNLKLKGDIKRESWWVQQYGQAVCTCVAGLLVWRLDPFDSGSKAVTVVLCVALTSVACAILKRLFGRVRPGRENAGKFLGPAMHVYGSHRESFPSSHTAGAVALTTALATLYPQAAAVWWSLAIACALLRYVLDAHWPSDITAGAATGYAVAQAGLVFVPPVFNVVYRFALAHL